MKIRTKKKKRMTLLYSVCLSFLTLIIIGGIGSYIYYSHLQQELDQGVQTAQEEAYQQMQRNQPTEASNGRSDEKNDGSQREAAVSASNQQQSQLPRNGFKKVDKDVDYTGKDVKPLTVEDMKRVNAKKVIASFGVGTIEIPSIGMKLPILEGMSQENLSVGAGTMKPGQVLGKGNFALAGHYMTNAGLLFGGIKNVQVGDRITVQYQSSKAIFQVKNVQHIIQNEGQVISDAQGDGILTLITCDGAIEGTSGRVMVRATLLS